MRASKDDFIRDYNPILFDTCSEMSDAGLWNLYHRLDREIEAARELTNIKWKSMRILRQELECRGQIEVDDR